MQQRRNQLGGAKDDLRMAKLSAIVAESVDALARADEDELERCRRRVGKIELTGLDRGSLIGSDLGSRNLPVFARVLRATRANLDLLSRFGRTDPMVLEYLPHPAKRAE